MISPTLETLRRGAMTLVLASVSLVGVVAVAQDAPTLNNNTIDMDVEGIHLIFKQTPGTPIATAVVFFDGGTLLSSPETAGLEDFALAVATENGPADMTKAEYTAGLDAIGSSISGGANFDYATLSMDCVVSEFDLTWNVLLDVMQYPAFRADDVELAREEHLTALRTIQDNADAAARETVRADFYQGHPYANRPMGFEEALSSFTVEQLHAAMDALVVRERMTVVVVGDLDADHVIESVRQGFTNIPSDPDFAVPEVPEIAHEAGAVTIVERPDLPTNYILGYFPMPAMDDPDYAAARIGIEILSDRLFEEVRTRRNLSYAVSASIGNRRANSGALYVTATDPVTTLEVMYATVDEMITTPVTAQDLTDQIEGYLTRYYMALQSAGAQATLLGRWELLGGGRAQADAFVAALHEVTPEDVSRVLDTYVRQVRFGVVGDPAQIPVEIFSAR